MKLEKFFINSNNTIYESMKAIDKSGSKCLIVIDHNLKLKGTISDGDLRRSIIDGKKITTKISNIYNKNPKYVYFDKKNKKLIKDIFLKDYLDLLPVLNDKKQVIDIIKIDDIFDDKNIAKKFKIKLPVVIMAGGFGKRLKPFTDILPKPLIPINNVPVIDHIIENFNNNGVNKFIISLNYKSKIMRAYFEEMKKNIKIEFVEEKKPLGTIGSLSLLENKIPKSFFVTNCDVLIDYNYQEILNSHLFNKNKITIVACSKSFQVPYGNCKIDSDGNLLNIEEKPNYKILINTGMYVINREIIKFIPKNTKFDINNLIKILKDKKIKIGVFPISYQNWLDVGQWNEYKKTIDIFNEEIK